jgi:cardiolipin synthase
MDSTFFLVIAIIAVALQSCALLLALFGPLLPYKISSSPGGKLDSDQFRRELEALLDARIYDDTCIHALTNGDTFYPAELDAIRAARCSINLEAYIFHKGEVGKQFVDALAERARAGVKVNLVLDAFGSLLTSKSFFHDLLTAGGRVEWYSPLRWYTWPRINNRTHRELVVIDGNVGFIGGAGIADQWYKDTRTGRRWRDSMFRITGPAVRGLQSAFVENWLEASGEILIGKEYFPDDETAGKISALVVDSSPTTAGSTRARILFQTLLASAGKSIHISSPYFVPDHSARREMVRALRDRGVELKVVVPGKHSDHLLTRRSSRRVYGELLLAGAKIYEYGPSMMHAKLLVVDGLWSVVGSTNFDNRSFGLNDEVNLAAIDEQLAARISEDVARDIANSTEITYDVWKHRPVTERVWEWFGWLLDRQI